MMKIIRYGYDHDDDDNEEEEVKTLWVGESTLM